MQTIKRHIVYKLYITYITLSFHLYMEKICNYIRLLITIIIHIL